VSVKNLATVLARKRNTKLKLKHTFCKTG